MWSFARPTKESRQRAAGSLEVTPVGSAATRIALGERLTPTEISHLPPNAAAALLQSECGFDEQRLDAWSSAATRFSRASSASARRHAGSGGSTRAC